MSNKKTQIGQRKSLLAGASVLAAATAMFGGAAPAVAQEDDGDAIVVTGSRIVRQDYIANSPITTVTGEQVVSNADVTLETYLNTLPQVNPAGTTTSNNPGNGGQANIDLRGLGANRNLILIDGRRPMVSANSLTVDVNTIPAAMIESIEVITGGAGATYGADAIAGAVNIRLRDDFEGADMRLNWSNSTEFEDALEYSFSFVLGANFADGRGNAVFGFDRSFRESLTKAQRRFSAVATSTTGTPPEGVVRWTAANQVTEAGVDAAFALFGVGAALVTAQSGTVGFNQNGSLIFYGIANSPFDIQNFLDDTNPTDPVGINPNFYPDFYSYNFDAVNLLGLPLDRYSFMFKTNYETDSGIEFFAQAGWTEYTAASAIAPTPVPTPRMRAPGENTALQVSSPLIVPGQFVSGSLVIPVTNPFVAGNAGLMTMLNSRVGDDPAIVGSGATEPFRYGFRALWAGLRQQNFENTIVQFMGGIRGDIGDSGWDYEVSLSEGRTEIFNLQTGNINTQVLADVLLNPATGANGACSTWNPLGNNAPPAACSDALLQPVSVETAMTMQVGQAFIRGDLAEMPAGPLAAVFGVEWRGFEYTSDYLTPPGPFTGFNVGDPEGGNNSFTDFFAEALVPLVSDAPFARTLELSLGYRYSTFSFEDTVQNLSGPSQSGSAYKAEINWEPTDFLRVRGSFQHSVRAPNFGELFAGGLSFPQFFDPCSQYTQFQQGNLNATAGQSDALCAATGVANPVTFNAAPGGQASLTTAGNTELDPEEADTYTVGLVFQSPFNDGWLSRFRASIDYYNITVDGPILTPDVNTSLAACYNYYGTNPTVTLAGNPYCQGLIRSGGTIAGFSNPNDPNGLYPGVNGGVLETSGIDFQAEWGFDWAWLGAPESMGSVTFNVLVSRLLDYTQADAADDPGTAAFEGLPALDYTGTIGIFGGLGTSFPEIKATINTRWEVGDFAFDLRARYIDAMRNRMEVIFPGETFFGFNYPGTATPFPTGVDSVWYFDVAGTWNVTDNVSLRMGVNNLEDLQPPEYAPNFQSGTDPSTYDVIGRRVFAQVHLRF